LGGYLRVGVDVGGTHTDAVILDKTNRVIQANKTQTTADVTGGVRTALHSVIKESGVDPEDVGVVSFGTTHCTNAIVERKRLVRVGVIRIGAPATLAIKPFTAFPVDLREAVSAMSAIVPGGHEFDGRELTKLGESEIRAAARRMKESGVDAIAVCSVFSPVNSDHEKRAAEIVAEEIGEQVSVTLSNEVASIGLLERENAAALNAAVTNVARSAIESFKRAMGEVELKRAKLFLTQNDGTLMSAEYALKYPIRTIASGPTNSIRGAAFLTGLHDGIVVDIGGTTTLVGAIIKGFPRESAVAVEIGGVRTNFRMPDLVAVGCGGGTVAHLGPGEIRIGPESLGYELTAKGMAWGGQTLTTTDIALAAGYATINDPRCETRRLSHLSSEVIRKGVEGILAKVQLAIDAIKTSAESVPAVLVGGGGILIPPERYTSINGVSRVLRPQSFQYANAIGAAIAQVSGEVDRVYFLEQISRESALVKAKELAQAKAIEAGARPDSVEVVEVDEIPLAYMPGNATRIRVKAAGSLSL